MNEAARLLNDRAANDRLAAAGLLAPDEPAPFEVLNPDATRPLLLVCDHASRFIPRALGGDLGLEPHAIEVILPTYLQKYRPGGRFQPARPA